MPEPGQAKGKCSFHSLNAGDEQTQIYFEKFLLAQGSLKISHHSWKLKVPPGGVFFMVDPDSGNGCEQNFGIELNPCFCLGAFDSLWWVNHWWSFTENDTQIYFSPLMHAHSCSGSDFSCAVVVTWPWRTSPTCFAPVPLIWRLVWEFNWLQGEAGNTQLV